MFLPIGSARIPSQWLATPGSGIFKPASQHRLQSVCDPPAPAPPTRAAAAAPHVTQVLLFSMCKRYTTFRGGADGCVTSPRDDVNGAWVSQVEQLSGCA